MTPTEAAAKWNAATEASPYSEQDFDRDTEGLIDEADAYLRSLDEPYKRFQASNWNPAMFSDAYGALPADLRYNSEATLPPPPPEEIAHHFDSLPTGTIIEKTLDGFALHPSGSFTSNGGPAIGVHIGGFNGFLRKMLHWLHLS